MSDATYERISVVDAQMVETGFRPMMSLQPDTPMQETPADVEDPADTPAPQPDIFAIGYDAGMKAAEARFAPERAALKQLVAAAAALQPEPSDELAVLIAETVEGLVTKIVGAVELDRAELAERAQRAAALVGDCDNARTMWVNPEDMALLEGADLPLALCADNAAARGSIRIDCSAGWIEAGTALYLDALRVELGLKDTR